MEAKLTDQNTTPFFPLIQAFFVLLWSSGFILTVFGLRYVHPFTFLFYRLLFAALFMLLIVWITKAPWPNNWNAIKKTLVTGLLIQFLYLTTYYYTLFYGVGPTVMSIILAFQPLLTAVICNLMLKQTVTRAQYLGLFVGLIGVFITVIHKLSTNEMTPLSFILAMVCLGAITIGAIIQKNNSEVDLRTGSTIQFAVSLVPLFFLTFFFGSFAIPMVPTFLFSLGWLVLVVSVSGNLLYYKLLKDGNAVKINSLFYLMPPMTAIFCYLVFDQPFNRFTIAGIVFVVLGVLITQNPKWLRVITVRKVTESQ